MDKKVKFDSTILNPNIIADTHYFIRTRDDLQYYYIVEEKEGSQIFELKEGPEKAAVWSHENGIGFMDLNELWDVCEMVLVSEIYPADGSSN